MKLPVQSHQQSVRVQCHLKPLQLRHTGCSRLWKVGVSEAQFWITMDKSKFLGLYWTDVSIYEQLHMWASKWLRCPPSTWIYPEMSFLPWRWYFTIIFQKSPSLHCSGLFLQDLRGQLRLLLLIRRRDPFPQYFTRHQICLARGMQNTVIIQRSGPRQWQSQQYRQIWSKCWGEILIRSPSC